MKSCPKEEILQAYLDGELAADAGAAVRVHLAACAPCAAAVREMEQAFAVMSDAFADELPDAVPTARLRARIESALAEQAAPRFAQEFVWMQWFWRFGWAAAAAAIAGMIGWALLGTHSVTPPQQADVEKRAPSATPELPLPSPPSPEPEIAQQPPRPRHRVRQQAMETGVEDAEVVTEFYPLREGEDLTAIESMQLVRIELPSSALSEVGLPVAPEAANAPIKADVALGDDGLARAIRFVR